MYRVGIRGIFIITIALFNAYCLVFAGGITPSDLERIVITRAAPSLLNTYSLKYDELRGLPFNSPLEALGFSYVDLSSRSPRYGIQTDFSLRGCTFQGVLFLLNDSRINDPQTGHHNSDIPLTEEDIERIDVMPGAGSSIYGPDSLGGSVNIIVKKPEGKRMVLDLSSGSYQTKSLICSLTNAIDDKAFRLSLERVESGGFRYDTDFKKFTSTLSALLRIPDGDIDLFFGYGEKEFGAFDFYTPGLNYPSMEWTKTYLLDTTVTVDKEGTIFKPGFLWRRHYDKFMLDKTGIKTAYLNHHRTDMYTPKFYCTREVPVLGKVGGGLEYGQEEINSTNLGQHSRIHTAIILENRQDLAQHISYATSLRLDDFDSFGDVYTGSINFKYNLQQDRSLHFAVSRSMRIPSFTELYYNDPTTSGEPGLSPEQSINYEAGYDYSIEPLSFGATVFFRDEKDMIDWVKHISSQSKWKAENITEADVAGIEGYFRININDYINLNSNYTYINKNIKQQGLIYKYGSNYIQHLFNTNFNFNLPFGKQSILFHYKKRPHRHGWFILGAELSGAINKNSRIYLKATNLLNVEYQEIEGIPQPGRWLEAGLRFEW